jgi:hypothetical protein
MNMVERFNGGFETGRAARPGPNHRAGHDRLRRNTKAGPSLALAAGLALFGLAAATRQPAAAQAGTDRPGEAVTIPGSELAPFVGATEAQLWLWSYRGGSWNLVVRQLDERNSGNSYVANEDGKLDANDELVFMLEDAGEKPPEGARPPAMPADAYGALITLTDPLLGKAVGWLTLMRSDSGPEIALNPRVSYDAEARLIWGADYGIGMASAGADGFYGLRAIYPGGATAGAEDIVDRFKIRGQLSVLGLVQPVDEENISTFLVAAGFNDRTSPIKVGLVRAVLGSGGYAYAHKFTLLGNLKNLATIGGGGGLGFELSDGRVSLDLNPAASGLRYRDANLSGGVVVDGQPDTVPAAPAPAWRELSGSFGRLVFLSQPAEAGASARAYYKDDETTDPGDTGDLASWGDMGVSAPDFASLTDAGFPDEVLRLPAGGPTAAQLLAWRDAPVTAAMDFDAVPPSATPSETSTRTPTATRTPTVTPTATGGRISPTVTSTSTVTPTRTPSVTPDGSETPGTMPPTPVEDTPTAGPPPAARAFIPYVLRP